MINDIGYYYDGFEPLGSEIPIFFYNYYMECLQPQIKLDENFEGFLKIFEKFDDEVKRNVCVSLLTGIVFLD
jgi:hypothetical protein